MKTCAVQGRIADGAMCGSVIVGGKHCGLDGTCPHQRDEKQMAGPDILPVSRATRDGGAYVVRCPHCKDLIALEGDDMSQIRGEQYQHRACGGWLEVTHNARFVGTL